MGNDSYYSPEKTAKARSELLEVIGKDDMVQESDISRLSYLQAIVKETLRLHPAAPLLVPRKTEVDVDVEGFVVPKNAQILVKVWAIGCDSSVWMNQSHLCLKGSSTPKLTSEVSISSLFPFGAERRMCPGLLLAYKLVHLIFGSLLHSFCWKLEGEMKAEDVDMSEKFGLTLQKAESLKVIPIIC